MARGSEIGSGRCRKRKRPIGTGRCVVECPLTGGHVSGGHVSPDPKAMLGETTTLQEKIRAFKHWLFVLQNPQPYEQTRIHHAGEYASVKVFSYETITEPYRPNGAQCEQIVQELGDGKLQHPFTVLHCVHDQWRKLQVFVDPGTKSILYIRGKASDTDESGEKGVARDDLWMAFSIGMQWCSRFTQMLPTKQARSQLVDYMERVRLLLHSAIEQCLKDASRTGCNSAAVWPATYWIPSHHMIISWKCWNHRSGRCHPTTSVTRGHTPRLRTQSSNPRGDGFVGGGVCPHQCVCRTMRCHATVVAQTNHGYRMCLHPQTTL